MANLPYQVAATIVLAYFEHLPQLRAATVMVQREVAERMAANPGTKAYGAYTVKLALQAKATGSFSVARTSFLPPPRVDSTVIRLERAAGPGGEPGTQLATLIDTAFAMRRKTLVNNLKAVWPAQQVSEALADCGLDPAVRAEALTPEDFARLLSALHAS